MRSGNFMAHDATSRRSPVASEVAPLQLDPAQQARNLVLLWIVTGIVVRMVIAAISVGSNDAVIWEAIAQSIRDEGFLQTYRATPMMNHPPIPPLWAVASLAMGGGTWFSFLMKLPGIASDAAACVLAARIWSERGDSRRAHLAAMAIALNPVAILVSGYHCNTDNVYAWLSLLAAWLLSGRKRFFYGGLALGAAINVKLIPLVLVPVAFSICRDRRQVLRLLAGLAICVVPFTPLLAEPQIVYRNMLSYNSLVSQWGIPLFLIQTERTARFSQAAAAMMQQYLWIGRVAIVASVLGLSAASAVLRRWNAYELFFIAYALFLVLAPGFGVQYAVIVVPLLAAISLPRSWQYGLVCGLFLLFIYWVFLLPGGIPLQSRFGIQFLMPGPLFGLLAWWVLLVTAGGRLLRASDPPRGAIGAAPG